MASDAPAGLVLDASLLVAYHNDRDVHHRAAAEVMDRLLAGDGWSPALLPEYVFLEVATVLARRRDPPTAVAACGALLVASELEFVPCSEIFLDAFEVFREVGQEGLSFTDAAIVAIARKRGIEQIATFDPGFRTVSGLMMVPAGERR